MKREMELELKLKEAQTAYGMLFDQKAAARNTVIANAFSEFIAPEGTRLVLVRDQLNLICLMVSIFIL